MLVCICTTGYILIKVGGGGLGPALFFYMKKIEERGQVRVIFDNDEEAIRFRAAYLGLNNFYGEDELIEKLFKMMRS